MLQTPKSTSTDRQNLSRYIQEQFKRPEGSPLERPRSLPRRSRRPPKISDAFMIREAIRILEGAGVTQYRLQAGPKVVIVADQDDAVFHALTAARAGAGSDVSRKDRCSRSRDRLLHRQRRRNFPDDRRQRQGPHGRIDHSVGVFRPERHFLEDWQARRTIEPDGPRLWLTLRCKLVACTSPIVPAETTRFQLPSR